MSDHKRYRTRDEWFELIQECRRSGMTDAQWCQTNGINHAAFKTAVKRLRKCSYEVPYRQSSDIHDLTITKQDVVRVDIVPDVQPPANMVREETTHFDNSHMIEITFGDIHITLNNGADPVLVSKTISILRNFS